MKVAGWMHSTLLAALVVAGGGLVLSGCGFATSSSAPLPAEGEQEKPGVILQTSAITEAEPSIDPAAPPEKVVEKFLDALKKADDRFVAFLLTSKACEEIHRRDMVIQPPGKPGARFVIGEVEFAPDRSGAYVTSSWTEEGSEPYEIVWIMRSEPAGWRVAGMAASVDPNQEPLVLNFEDPDDVLEKSRAADEQLREADAGAAAERR